jgi:hypothetical protein
MGIKPTQKKKCIANTHLTTDHSEQTTGIMGQPEPKRIETHYTSAQKLVQAQSISCVPLWNALDVPVFGTSRPQNPPCLTIVLHWFWGYTCSYTRTFTENTITFPSSSTQQARARAHTHIHTHTLTGYCTATEMRIAFQLHFVTQQLSGSVKRFRRSMPPIRS